MRSKSSEKPKPKHKKGLWSPDEDQKLRDYIVNHGLGCWSAVPIHAGLQRNGKSCRLRWINYLRPGLKRGIFTIHEEEIIMTLHGMLGNKWSQMSQHLPGRTDNEIKNHWHSYLKKKLDNLDAQNTPSPSNYTQNDSKGSSTPYSKTDGCRTSPNQTEPVSQRGSGGSRPSPKIIFAEWLSLDQFYKLDTPGRSFVSSDGCHYSSDSQKTVMNGDIQEGSSYGLANSVDHLQLKYEDQQVECGFYDLISEDDICQNFRNSDVTLYSCDDLYSASTPSQTDARFVYNLGKTTL